MSDLTREQIEAFRTWHRAYKTGWLIAPAGLETLCDMALRLAAVEREAKRLVGVFGHVREHITRTEDFDADELRKDIEGSVDLSEFDRFQLRAEKAEAALAQAEREREADHLQAELGKKACEDYAALEVRAEQLKAALREIYGWMMGEYREEDPTTGEIVEAWVLPMFKRVCEALAASSPSPQAEVRERDEHMDCYQIRRPQGEAQ